MFKRILKWAGLLVLAGVILLGALAVNVIWFKPVTINLFFERAFLQYGLNSPQALTSIGVFDSLPFRFYQDELDEVSVERQLETQEWAGDNLATLRSYDREDLSGQKALSYDIFEWFLAQQVDGRRWMWHNFPVNQMFGIHINLPDFMLNIHPVRNEQDVDDYLTRLEQFPEAFGGTVEILEKREAEGVIPPRFAVEKALSDMRDFRARPAADNPLYTEFLASVDELDEFPADRRDRLPGELNAVIKDSVYPAYDTLIAYYEALLPKADSNDGVWRLPDGDEYYAWQLRGQTTTDYTPAEIHDIGLSEVDRIQAEMDAVLCDEGYCEGTVGERMDALNAEKRFLFADSDAGREAILAEFRTIIEEIEAGISEMFDVLPEADVEVRRVPEYRQEGSAGAYYSRPAMDGSRPGVFYANLRNVEEHPRYGLRTLAYHEAVPGHHFQIALQQELTGVPMFRKMLPFTAYTEGWALYAEQLAWEAGFQEDPYDNLGRLQAELFRAVRLVVDTGMHYKRWSRERAIEYMAGNTGMARSDVIAEIERYLVMPGQACAYKVGMMKLLELREKARRELGEAFDIREFHNRILMNGAMPLEVVESVIDRWIRETSGT